MEHTVELTSDRVPRLDGIWRSAHGLVQQYFYDDLTPEALEVSLNACLSVDRLVLIFGTRTKSCGKG